MSDAVKDLARENNRLAQERFRRKRSRYERLAERDRQWEAAMCAAGCAVERVTLLDDGMFIRRRGPSATRRVKTRETERPYRDCSSWGRKPVAQGGGLEYCLQNPAGKRAAATPALQRGASGNGRQTNRGLRLFNWRMSE